MVSPLLQTHRSILCTLEFFLLLDSLLDIVSPGLVNLLIRESVLEWGQEDVLRCDLGLFVVFFELIDLLISNESGAILTNIIINSVIDLLKSFLLVPSFLIVLINDSLNTIQSLSLPLVDLSRKFIATTTAISGLGG